jgi:3-methyladenine DNA glycosylase AlkD
MTSATLEHRQRSAVTERAVAFVAERRDAAEGLGRRLADDLNDPEAFAAALTSGLTLLSDPEYLEGQRRVAPGIGHVLGVRWPLIEAVKRGFRDETKRDRSTAPFLFIAERLFRERALEQRWFAFGILERTVAADPERTWQLLRRAAREAEDWITVDSLAHPFGKGILNEAYRWAELEQLVYSPSRWERRLVGSTIATIPFIDRRRGRAPELADHAVPLVASLMGDSEPDVQKALAWALRSLVLVDRAAVDRLLADETERAARTSDGHRAWVIRDVLAKIDPGLAAQLRAGLDGIRRRSGAPSTSSASAAAAAFAGPHGLPDPRMHPEPPL